MPFCKVGGLHRAPSTRLGPAYDYNYSYGDFDPAVDCSAYQYIAEPSAALECDGILGTVLFSVVGFGSSAIRPR